MSADFGAEWFAEAANVSRETLSRLQRYAALLLRWQGTINLVASSTLPNLWRRHMLDSAQLWTLAPASSRLWLDLGSGAGFPGLVIAALASAKGQDMSIHLVESDTRKCAFLRAATIEMNVGATVHNCRIEAMPALDADVISARALAPLDRILGYAAPFAGTTTRLLLPKGRGVDRELENAAQEWRFDADVVPSQADAESCIVVINGFTRA